MQDCASVQGSMSKHSAHNDRAEMRFYRVDGSVQAHTTRPEDSRRSLLAHVIPTGNVRNSPVGISSSKAATDKKFTIRHSCCADRSPEFSCKDIDCRRCWGKGDWISNPTRAPKLSVTRAFACRLH